MQLECGDPKPTPHSACNMNDNGCHVRIAPFCHLAFSIWR